MTDATVTSGSAPEADRPFFITGWSASLMQSISAVRAPAIMSLLAIVVLWLPQQTWEVYRVLLQQRVEAAPSAVSWQWLMAVGALFLLSIVLWQVARELTYAASERHDIDSHPVGKFVLDWSPRVFATTPFVGVALGLWASLPPPARREPLDLPLEQVAAIKRVVADAEAVQATVQVAIAAAVVMAIVIFLLITFFERRFLHVAPDRQLTEARGRRLFFINHWFLFPLVGAVSIVAFAWQPIALPQYFGVVPIFAMWVAISTVLMAVGTRVYDLYRVPVVSIAVLAVLVFEFYGWSDNHRFRQLRGTTSRTELRTAFMDWVASRKDAQAYRDAKRPYPVYIVAAEGGGMYAAYHTAKLLARMQDLCENFSQHLFAVSSVSGGSLGAGVFAALANKNATNSAAKPCAAEYQPKPNGFEADTEKLLSYDFLSPLIWAGLFPDFVQRFLPVAINQFDRARALEKGFEFAWSADHGSEKNPFAGSFFALCTAGTKACPQEATAVPALLLNTTIIETGTQAVLSPLYLGYTAYSSTGGIEDFYRSSADIRQMRLSTAVGLSSRFPWILPAGWHNFTLPPTPGTNEKPRRYRMSFADGGYFEGSGALTADNLAQYLMEEVLKPNGGALNGLDIALKIILITGTYQPMDHFFETDKNPLVQNELTSPLATLLNAWRARNSAFPTELASEKGSGPYTVMTAPFDNYYVTLPLGWQLTKLSREYLGLFAGTPQHCIKKALRSTPVAERVDLPEPVLSMNTTDCVVQQVVEDLAPQGPPPVTGSTR
ncbi:MAG TPA: hypothetical protein VG900_12825 [Hyphomicrobiaceae bacterium]|jgi:hypothetical protein|nr:hypothetical protein [Hyphomicrobiaceae bacterium]